MSSRVYLAVLKWKQIHRSSGGRGNTHQSDFIRLPHDVLADLDGLIDEFTTRYGDYPESPRNARLFDFLRRLDELFPSDPFA